MEANRPERPKRVDRFHLGPLAALTALFALTAVVTVYTHLVVQNQDHRLLQERANEVELVLSVSINTISGNMSTLARVEVRGGIPAFQQEAAAQLAPVQGTPPPNPTALALVRPAGGGYTVVAAGGPGLTAGQSLGGDPARALTAARSTPKMTATGLYRAGGTRAIGFALRTAGGDLLLYRQVLLGPVRAPAAAGTAPFSELRVALYGSPQPDPHQVIVTTTRSLPLRGTVRYVPLMIGPTKWLVAVAAVHPLVGSFAASAEWVALGVGAVGSVLVFLLLEAMATRRDAALDALAVEHRFAETLQRRLLPAVPDVAGLDIATSYVPGADHQKVGGDWFDVFTLGNGQVGIAIGDVMGHDVEAAATMSQLRASLRSYATENQDPVWTVDRLARFVDMFSIPSVVTVVFGFLDPPGADGARRFRWANAGHLPPLLRRPDGSVEELALPASPLLGAPSAVPRPLGDRMLPPGSLLLLYTDGLVEMQGDDLSVSIIALRHVLEGAHQPEASSICEAVLAAHHPGSQRDDIALLAVGVEEVARAEDEPVQLGYGRGGSPRS